MAESYNERMADDSSNSTPLCQYMDELIDSLRKDIPAALKRFDEDAIHDTRVATRRLKAAIELLEPVLTDEHRKPVAKAGKRLRRRLGAMRDLDVMIDALEPFLKQRSHGEAATWLRDRLVHARESARDEAKSESSPHRLMARLGSWWGLREEVIESSEKASHLLAHSLHNQLESFAEQADQLGNHDSSKPHDPHAVRIAGKALRYTLEMAKRDGHDLPDDVAKTFKKLQDALGRWHDLVVLTERAMQESIAALLPHHDPEMQKKVMALAKLLLDRSVRELQKFSALWSEKGKNISAIIC
ncbi:MAG: CHAD domain-containing protein, partial [Phycisphaerae bacterium]|nr:CHAD domain-containing protein [Phycisphaerae bacterium]